MTAPDPEATPCWSYRGEQGQEHWGRLHPDWRACGEGLEQSPIALPSGEVASGGESFALHYRATAGRLTDNPHMVRVDMAPGSRLLLGEEAFPLRQFHFHTPSEHLWSDAAEAGELHLVHRSDAGGTVVLAVALRLEAAQALPPSLWEWLREARVGESLALDPSGLVPRDGRFLAYRGSLTVPPCTEGVRWLLASEPLAMTPEQRRWLERRRGPNARSVQPLGARSVCGIRRVAP